MKPAKGKLYRLIPCPKCRASGEIDLSSHEAMICPKCKGEGILKKPLSTKRNKGEKL